MILLVSHFNGLTLYVPRFSTTHGRLASLPNATVTFGIGSTKRGVSVRAEKKTYIELTYFPEVLIKL